MKRSFVRSLRSGAFLIILLFASRADAQATVRRVPADYPTIQQAINASVNGDTVLVAPGTYVENINFVGKAITVTSESGATMTIIDGANQFNPVVTFASGETRASVIDGFTLKNGSTPFASGYIGGGINIRNASPTIRNNIISNNVACAGGAGIAIQVGSPLIKGNTIADNRQEGCSGGAGGGIYAAGTDIQILDNIIRNNSFSFGGGIAMNSGGASIIRGNLIQGNSGVFGGGIEITNGAAPSIIQNLIIGNRAGSWGGGIFWQTGSGQLINNTIVDNDAQEGSGMYAYFYDAQSKWVNNILLAGIGQVALFCGFGNSETPMVKNNDVFSQNAPAFGGSCLDQKGTNGNISADPLFVNPPAGNYSLQAASPSIDTGDNTAPNLPATDLDGNPRIQDGNGDGLATVDMGAYEATPQFDICIRDDSSGNLFKFNSTTGDYQFTNCAGLTLSGMGGLIRMGGILTLQHYASDRRVLARIDTTVNRAIASIQLFSASTTFTITDRNTTNNTCACNGS